MALIQPGDSLQGTFDDMLYAACRLAILADTKPLAARLDKDRAELRRLSGQRIEASDDVVRAQAVRDFALEQVQGSLLVFEKGIDHMCARDPTEYAGWFPLTPARMNKAPEKNRAQIFGPIIAKARALPDGSLVHGEAKTFVELWDAYLAAEGRHAEARKAVIDADKAVQAQKAVACVTMREVYGLLVAKYPDNLARAAAYFRKRGRKVPKKTRKSGPADESQPATPAPRATEK